MRPWNDRIMPAYEVERVFNTRLKACPFCGCLNVALYLGPTPHITCMNCEADGPAVQARGHDHRERQGMSVRLWNARGGVL